MSHLKILVVGDDIQQQLGPYMSAELGHLPRTALTFIDTEKEDRLKWQTQSSLNNVALNVMHPTFEAYMGGCNAKRDPHTLRYGYWKNPQQKLVGFAPGGRFECFLLKPGATAREVGLVNRDKFYGRDTPEDDRVACSARKRDIDFIAMKTLARSQAEKTWDWVWVNVPDIVERMNDYGIWPEEPRNEFITRRETLFLSASVILSHGIWQQQKEHGSDLYAANKQAWEEYVIQFINDLPDAVFLTIIDGKE